MTRETFLYGRTQSAERYKLAPHVVRVKRRIQEAGGRKRENMRSCRLPPPSCFLAFVTIVT